MNRFYTYPNIGLWSGEAWKDADAKIHPLVVEIARLNEALVKPVSISGKYADRTGTAPDPKTNVTTLPDVIEVWAEKGLRYHFAGMGTIAWISMVPEHAATDTPVLLTFHCTDMKNCMWAMETLEYYKNDLETAAKKGFAILFIVQSNAFASGIYMDILQELSALSRLALNPLYLNLSILKKQGTSLEQVPGLDCALFPAPEDFHGIPVLNVTDRWAAYTGHQFICKSINSRNPEFNTDRLVHSTLGRKIADGMHWEHDYKSFADEGIQKEFTEKGLDLCAHFTKGERWLTVTPKEFDEPKPLLLVMKETRTVNDIMTLTALQFYSEFIEIAANGEFAMLFFALESPDDNELLLDLVDEMKKLYPIDASRIYITGQSHNGYLAMEFARRHPELITAIATLNDRHGIATPAYSVDPVPITDEMVQTYAKTDLPLINLCGVIENVFPHTPKGTPAFDHQVQALHRRLAAFRIPDRTDEEIIASLESPDKATRINGLPADHTEIQYSMGLELYISDLKNIDGKWHLRFVTLENMPHMISPQMADITWSFLRRFRRAEDGTIEE